MAEQLLQPCERFDSQCLGEKDQTFDSAGSHASINSVILAFMPVASSGLAKPGKTMNPSLSKFSCGKSFGISLSSRRLGDIACQCQTASRNP